MLKKLIKFFKIENAGAFAIEYALLLPVFLTITIGSMEVGRIFMVYAALEGAVTESTRIAITGSVPDGYETTDAYINDFITKSLKDFGIDAGVTISMKVYDSFSDIGAEEPYTDTNGNQSYDIGECYTDVNNNATWDDDMGASGSGGEENIMLMKISVALPYITSFIGAFSEPTINLSTSTAVRNEPYGGIAWEPSDNVICT